MTLAHLQQLVAQKERQLQLAGHGLAQLACGPPVAGELAALQQCRHRGDVLAGGLSALGRRAHAVADFQANVPAGADEALDVGDGVVGQGRGGRTRRCVCRGADRRRVVYVSRWAVSRGGLGC